MRIVAAPVYSPPFPVEAATYEEDTFLIMSPGSGETGEAQHPIRMMAELESFRPRKVGSVLVRKGPPLRLLAVVHDVNREPTCREQWVEKALSNLFQKADQLGLRSLSMPLLANRHGRLPIDRLALLLSRILQTRSSGSLEQIWVVSPVPDNARFIHALTEHLCPK
jgi:hypothetical protein